VRLRERRTNGFLELPGQYSKLLHRRQGYSLLNVHPQFIR